MLRVPALAPPISRHASAHLRQASAHSWQRAILCFAHSAPHASHTSAQSWQTRSANSDPRAISRAAKEQMSAQLRSSSMHRVIILTSSSCRHAVAQCSHASIHSWQASMQVRYFSCDILISCSMVECRQRQSPGCWPSAVPEADRSRFTAWHKHVRRYCSRGVEQWVVTLLVAWGNILTFDHTPGGMHQRNGRWPSAEKTEGRDSKAR